MTYKRLAYDDAATPAEMISDSKAVELAMPLPRQLTRMGKTAMDAIPDRLVPPPQVRRVQFAVSDAAAKLAGKLFD